MDSELKLLVKIIGVIVGSIFSAALITWIIRTHSKCIQEQALRTNEYANAKRLMDWMNNPKRKPATLSFTEGPERQVAYTFEFLHSQEQARNWKLLEAYEITVEDKQKEEFRAQRYRQALENIVKHYEIIAPSAYRLSAVWNIANAALENEEVANDKSE